jgi:hypothetical protein
VVRGEVVMVYSSQRSHQDSDGHSRANESVVSIMQSNKNSMRLQGYNPLIPGFKGITN